MRRLLAVYGLKTRDYGYLSRFYPTARLIEACENRSIPLRFLFPEDVTEFLSGSGSLPFAESARLPSRDDFSPDSTVCLVRGSVGLDTVCLLESRGYRCVNPSSAIGLANDKIATARFLERQGFPTPRTASLDDLGSTFAAADYPLVAKPRQGSRGEGVTLVATEGEARSLARELLPESDAWIFQEYIAQSRGRDLRAFFASGEILACVERIAPDGALVTNTARGGAMREPRFGKILGEPWNDMVRAIAERSGLWYGTVDFLYRDEEGDFATARGRALDLTVCEINAAPGFEALETATGIDIAGMLVDRLLADFS